MNTERGWMKGRDMTTVLDADVLTEAARLSPLIAAAPELLAVAEAWLEHEHGYGPDPTDATRAAIARARGDK